MATLKKANHLPNGSNNYLKLNTFQLLRAVDLAQEESQTELAAELIKELYTRFDDVTCDDVSYDEFIRHLIGPDT